MDLRRRYNLVAAEVEHVRCDTFQAGYDFAGGNYGSKDHPWHKEQGDYNLKYLISAALHGMIVISQSTVCSLRLKKRKGDSNPKGTGCRQTTQSTPAR